MSAEQPLYALLKEAIIAQVQRGTLRPGDQIPSQRALVQQYNMSHMTVRRALNELVYEGVLVAVPGKGVYIAQPNKQEAEAGPFISFTEDMTRRGLAATSMVLQAEIVGATTTLARVLETSLGDPLVCLRRLRLADGEPVALQTAFLPHTLFPGLLTHDFTSASLYGVLASEYGALYGHSETAVEAAIASEEQARLLGLESPAAVLITEQVTWLADGTVAEFTRSAYRSDRFKMLMRQPERIGTLP